MARLAFRNNLECPAMNDLVELRSRLERHVSRERLIDTAVRLIEVPSPTGQGGAVADRLAAILDRDGFSIQRPDANHPAAPAVVARLESGTSGKTLQFNGHLDTVHLPFVPPRVNEGVITGSGASDMKAGAAAAVEAMRALRDADALSAGAVLLTAHDLHEAPWGDGRQLDALIATRCVGDAVLLPEPLHESLPVIGRGSATWKVTVSRKGPPVHEVMRPRDEPSVIAAGAELVARLARWNDTLAAQPDPLCGAASVFVGQIHAGEIFNQYPRECWLEGTRRWLPGTDRTDVEREFFRKLEALARETGTSVGCRWSFIRDAFVLDQDDSIVDAFQTVHAAVSGAPLPIGPKPFVDDGNSFWALGRVPAITHGPRAGGQHTVDEWVSIDDLVRVAVQYAMTAALYCTR